MLPFLPLPIDGPTTPDPPADKEQNESRKRRASAPPRNWAFFALPWGPTEKSSALPVVGLEAFGQDKARLLRAAKRFTQNAFDGCGSPNIAEGLNEELGFAEGMLPSKDVMLVTGVFDVATSRVVALMTVSVGGSDGDLGVLVRGLQKRYTDVAWFDEAGSATPLVTPSNKQLGGVLGYKDRLTFYIEHLCSAGSAQREASQVSGAGSSIMRQTTEYLKAHATPLVIQAYKRASMRKPKRARLVTDEWIAGMLRRDLWLHLYSMSSAVDFYKKQGFEIIPTKLQETYDPTFLVRDNRMWRPLYMS